MALLRDEGGEDFLVKGVYPRAAERAFDALLRYMEIQGEVDAREEAKRLKRRAAGDPEWHYSSGLYAPLRLWSFDFLSKHPMEERHLARLNWKHERPRLDVHISAGHHRRLEGVHVFVCPAAETLQLVEGRWRFHDVSTDFQSFEGGHYGLELGEVTVLEFTASREVLFDDYYPRSRDEDGLLAARLGAARELIFHAVQHKLHQLSMHFNCRLQSRLIMYGPEKTLEVRRSNEDWSRRAGLHRERAVGNPSILDVSGWNTPVIQEFIAKHSGSDRWLRNFVERRRDSRSSEALQEELADYMELPRHEVDRSVVIALVAATDGVAFARRALEMLADKAVLKSFIAEKSVHQGSWLERAAEITRCDKYQLLVWLLKTHPSVMCAEGVQALHPTEVFSLALELLRPYRAKECPLTAKARVALDRMLAAAAGRAVPHRSGSGGAARPLAKSNQMLLARLAQQRTWDGLMAWADSAWPQLAQQLALLNPAPTTSHSGRSGDSR